MTIEVEADRNGGTRGSIKLTAEEDAAIDRCHEILKARFEERGEPYSRGQKEMCEWWLQGILRFEGLEKMVSMVETAPFSSKKELVACGYAEVREV